MVSYAHKEGATSSDQPDFIATPVRTDGENHGVLLGVRLAHEGHKDAHAKMKAFQEEAANNQDSDQDELKRIEIHDMPPLPIIVLVLSRGFYGQSGSGILRQQEDIETHQHGVDEHKTDQGEQHQPRVER